MVLREAHSDRTARGYDTLTIAYQWRAVEALMPQRPRHRGTVETWLPHNGTTVTRAHGIAPPVERRVLRRLPHGHHSLR